MKLKNKTALITGASRGIGKAIALLFAQEGANIALHCLKRDQEEEILLKELEKYGVKVMCFEADLTNVSLIKEMVTSVQQQFRQIDILVNNAAIYSENSFFESTEESWQKVLDTNLKNAYFCSQFAAKIMLEQKSGNIINISSVAGVYPRKVGLEYAISKAGLIHFSQSLALILAPRIRVNAIAPSYTWTSFMKSMEDPKWVEEKMKLIPLVRFNDAEDIAKSALFLASDDSKNITGQVLVIDGGRGANI